MDSFGKNLLDKTIPTDARKAYIRYLSDSEASEDLINFFTNLESLMSRYAGKSNSLVSPLEITRRYFEFDNRIRSHFLTQGSKLILSSFKEGPLSTELIPLCEMAIDRGFDLASGAVESVCICPKGSARLTKRTLLRLQGVSTLLDFLWGQGSAHVVRFLGNQNDQGTFGRLREFRKMVKILMDAGAKTITGSAASANDPSVRMDEMGNWRFKSALSVWQDVSLTRLEKFWMRTGFISEKLLGGNSSKMVLLSPENALILSEELKAACTGSPCPYHYLCPTVSIFDQATLLKLRE